MAAQSFFIAFDGIDGESTDASHKGEIDVEFYSWGVETVPAGGGSGPPPAHPTWRSFTFGARTSKATPVLLLSAATGKRIQRASFTARRSGKVGLEYLKLRFDDVVIATWQQQSGAPEDARTLEQMSFTFSKLSMDYYPAGAGGQAAQPVHIAIDVAGGKKS